MLNKITEKRKRLVHVSTLTVYVCCSQYYQDSYEEVKRISERFDVKFPTIDHDFYHRLNNVNHSEYRLKVFPNCVHVTVLIVRILRYILAHKNRIILSENKYSVQDQKYLNTHFESCRFNVCNKCLIKLRFVEVWIVDLNKSRIYRMLAKI